MKINSILAIFVALSLIGQGFCEIEDVCRYIPSQTIFRCNNVMPVLVIVPGSEQNISIKCCVTADYLNNTDIYEANLDIIPEQVLMSNYMRDGERVTEANISYYNSSKWISKYYLPNDIMGFKTFEVILTYKTPLFSEEYVPNMALRSRLDLSLNIPGKMIPQLILFPSVRLPIDYKPINYYAAVAFLSTATLAALILFILTFKNNRIYQNIKKSFKKKSKKISETKEEKSEKN